MRLTELKENDEAVVKNILDKSNAFLKRIQAMGLKKGEKIKVERIIGRNVVVILEGRKIAIDKSLAEKIEVEK
jgi:ferrous iron transport protein A